jgi:hypothetical protein
MGRKSAKARRVLRPRSRFGRHDRDALVRRSSMKNRDFPHDLLDGRATGVMEPGAGAGVYPGSSVKSSCGRATPFIA